MPIVKYWLYVIIESGIKTLSKIDHFLPRLESLGGMIYSLMGKIPRQQDAAELSGFRFTVEQVRAQRILYVRVEHLEDQGEEPD